MLISSETTLEKNIPKVPITTTMPVQQKCIKRLKKNGP